MSIKEEKKFPPTEYEQKYGHIDYWTKADSEKKRLELLSTLKILTHEH